MPEDSRTTLNATPKYTFHSSRYLTVTIILPLNAEIDMKKSSGRSKRMD